MDSVRTADSVSKTRDWIFEPSFRQKSENAENKGRDWILAVLISLPGTQGRNTDTVLPLTQSEARGPKRPHFCLLFFSVSPCLRGAKVFGCCVSHVGTVRQFRQSDRPNPLSIRPVRI